jgi:hypothetical protein
MNEENTKLIFSLIQQFPQWVLLILFVLFIIIVGFGIAAIKKGRPFGTPLFNFGGKPANELSKEEYAEIIRVVVKEVTSNQELDNNPKPKYFFTPSEIPDKTKYVYAAKLEIDRKIRDIAYSHGGGYAGITLARPARFYDALKMWDILDSDVDAALSAFDFTIRPADFGDEISDTQFNDIQYLYKYIMDRLENIPLGELGKYG